jgi:hypothetical protein
MRLPETSTPQKLIILLFVATILMSCITLVWIMVEKPDKKTTTCEPTGRATSMVEQKLSQDDKAEFARLVRNCTSQTNPPMSSGLSLISTLTTISGGLFLASASIYAYTSRKKIQQKNP